MRRSVLLFLIVAFAACNGGRHRRGDRQAVLSGSYGWPIEGHSLGFDGNGDAENFGLGAGVQWFPEDRWAAGLQLGYRRYNQPSSSGNLFDPNRGDGNVFTFEGTSRHYLTELGAVGILFELSGGGAYGDRPVPPRGTEWNWIFGYGPTFELPLSDTADLLFGYQWRHLSNGLGSSSPENPSQNDQRVWLGIALDW